MDSVGPLEQPLVVRHASFRLSGPYSASRREAPPLGRGHLRRGARVFRMGVGEPAQRGLRPESMTNGSGAAGIGVGFGNDQVLMPLRRVYDVR